MGFICDIGTQMQIPMRNKKTEEASHHASFCAMAASGKNTFTFAGLFSNKTVLPLIFNMMHGSDQSGQSLVACLLHFVTDRVI